MKKQIIRQQVFNKYGGKCAYCGCDLTKLHIDHIIPLRRHLAVGSEKYPKGENHIDNYNPCCMSCNSSKGSNDVEYFRKQIEGRHEFMIKYSSEYRSMVKFNRLTINNEPLKFYFETV